MGLISQSTLLAGLLTGITLQAQNPGTLERVSVDQVTGDSSALKIYADVVVSGGTEASGLSQASVQAQMEGKPVHIISLKRFPSTGEGVAYVFAVDVSRSVTPALFKSLLNEIRQFVERLRPADRAAIVAFGDDTRIVSQFTTDKGALIAAVSGLAATSQSTHLNLGLREALRLARRQDKSLPGRRAVIILSDGKDEGSGITADDVLRDIDIDRVPIYSVGASQLPAEDRAHYLDVLRRFSVLSGGEYYSMSTPSASGFYTRIQERVTRVWEATVDCSACITDGRSHPLQFTVNLGTSSLSDRLNVVITRPPPAPPAQPLPNRKRLWWYYGGGAFVALALALIAILVVRDRRRRTKDEEPASTGEIEEPAPGLPERYSPEVPEGGPILSDTGLKIQLTRRSGGGGRFEARLVNQLVAGRSSEAGLRLPDSGISGRHCMIELVDGRVLVSDLGSTHGTSVNGVPILGRQRVESGDSLALGPIEFNLRIQEWH
jgi:VWFA-related protein